VNPALKFLRAAAALAALAAPARGLQGGAYREMTLAQMGAFPYEVEHSYERPFDAWVESEKPKPKKQAKLVIPAWAKKLDGVKLAVPGFMVPFDAEQDGVLSFCLVKSIMVCCYGLAPRVNENIMCDMKVGQKTKFYINIPIKVYGTLHVEEVKDDGDLIALYRMDVDKVEKIEKPDPAVLGGAVGPSSRPTVAPNWLPRQNDGP